MLLPLGTNRKVSLVAGLALFATSLAFYASLPVQNYAMQIQPLPMASAPIKLPNVSTHSFNEENAAKKSSTSSTTPPPKRGQPKTATKAKAAKNEPLPPELRKEFNITNSKPVPGTGSLIDPGKFPPRAHFKSLRARKKRPLVVFGVPTVLRDSGSYLNRTMTSLLAHLDSYKKEHEECLFVLFVAEPDVVKAGLLLHDIRSSLWKEIDQGLVQVISVNPNYYPVFSVGSKIHESQLRVFWRTKQNLDTIYLMHFCQKLATFYVHLEDDISTRIGYFGMLKEFALARYEEKLNDHGRIPWVFLEFCPLGFIGKLFVASELSDFIAYLSIFYNEWPCDWLLATYTRTRACQLTLDFIQCKKLAVQHGIAFHPPLFQHIGYHSSLKGKVSHEKLKTFP